MQCLVTLLLSIGSVCSSLLDSPVAFLKPLFIFQSEILVRLVLFSYYELITFPNSIINNGMNIHNPMMLSPKRSHQKSQIHRSSISTHPYI